MTTQEAFLKIQAKPNEASRGDFMLGMLYLSERLCVLEAVIADRSRAFKPPTPAEAEEYAKTLKFDLNGEAFCAHYEARGWLMGKTKMKSWKAAIRTWKSRRDAEPQKPGPVIPHNLRDHGF